LLGIKSRLGRRARLSGLFVALALAVTPTAASANATQYWSTWSGGTGLSGRHGDITRSLLTGSWLNTPGQSYEVYAGAHYSGGNTLYASWAQGWGNACHNYGTNNIGAMFETPWINEVVNAEAGWYGGEGASYC
jgi:hypothetical protein